MLSKCLQARTRSRLSEEFLASVHKQCNNSTLRTTLLGQDGCSGSMDPGKRKSL